MQSTLLTIGARGLTVFKRVAGTVDISYTRHSHGRRRVEHGRTAGRVVEKNVNLSFSSQQSTWPGRSHVLLSRKGSVPVKSTGTMTSSLASSRAEAYFTSNQGHRKKGIPPEPPWDPTKPSTVLDLQAPNGPLQLNMDHTLMSAFPSPDMHDT